MRNITLKTLRDWDACSEGYDKISEHVSENEIISLDLALEVMSISDVVWVLSHDPDKHRRLSFLAGMIDLPGCGDVAQAVRDCRDGKLPHTNLESVVTDALITATTRATATTRDARAAANVYAARATATARDTATARAARDANAARTAYTAARTAYTAARTAYTAALALAADNASYAAGARTTANRSHAARAADVYSRAAYVSAYAGGKPRLTKLIRSYYQ